MSKFMTFVINLMVSKAISTDNIVLAFIQKIIAVSFDGKRMLSEIIFLMDMQEISAPKWVERPCHQGRAPVVTGHAVFPHPAAPVIPS